MRIRTHKKKDFTIISNSTAQDVNLDLEELGFLTRCLSMPEDWEFNTQHIWKNWNIGRDKIRSIFNSLIKKNHCIRVVEKNINIHNIDGRMLYEIFDETETCKKRVEELELEGFKVQHSGNFDSFKKCFRDPEKTAPDQTAPDSQGAYKETIPSLSNDKEGLQKNTTTKESELSEIEVTKEIKNGGGGSEDVHLINSKGQPISLSGSEIYRHFLKFSYPTSVIQQGIQEARAMKTPVNNIIKLLESICLRLDNALKNPTKSKQPIKKEREKLSYEDKPAVIKPTVKWGDYFKDKDKKE